MSATGTKTTLYEGPLVPAATALYAVPASDSLGDGCLVATVVEVIVRNGSEWAAPFSLYVETATGAAGEGRLVGPGCFMEVVVEPGETRCLALDGGGMRIGAGERLTGCAWPGSGMRAAVIGSV